MSKQLFDSLINELQVGNNEFVTSKLSELSNEQIDEHFREAQPFKSLGPASSNKVVIGSVSNLREKYLRKLITTAMVGFLFQMMDEYTVREDQLIHAPNKDDYMIEEPKQKLPKDFNRETFYQQKLVKVFQARFPNSNIKSFKKMEAKLSEEELIRVSIETKQRIEKLTEVDRKLNAPAYNDALQASVEAQSREERAVIGRFLNSLFKYGEKHHVQEGGHPIVDDPDRANPKTLRGQSAMYGNVPPNDTHRRFTSYYEINYENIRETTQNIYNVKPDLEHAMIVYDTVNSQDEANTFIHKYGATSKFGILSFMLNQWTLLGSFKENRERVDYYNKHNSIIKAILEQQEKDSALGEELMKNRVRSTKIKAEKVFGKDSPSFDAYRKLSPTELETKYNAKMEEIDENTVKITKEAIVDTETGQALVLDEDGVPTNALEVPITSINAKTGEVSKSRFFTRAEGI